MFFNVSFGLLLVILLIQLHSQTKRIGARLVKMGILLFVVVGLGGCGVENGPGANSLKATQSAKQKSTDTSSSASQKISETASSSTSKVSGHSTATSDSSKNAGQSIAEVPSNRSKSSTSTGSPSANDASTQIDTVKTPNHLIPVVVSKNVDGDTIHVRLSNGKDEDVRLLLIDTPEDVSPSKPVEPFGYTAANYAKKVLPVGKKIYIQEGVSGYTRGKYGRLLAYIYITPTDMYNLDVVKKGYARVAYIYPPNTQHLSQLQDAQSYAKARHRGIWSLANYVTSNGYSLAVACPYAKSHGYSTTGCPAGSSTASGSSVSSHSTASQGDGTSSASVVTQLGQHLTVHDGGEASVSVHSQPNILATIEVDYKSGPSHAKGLEPKKADSSGQVSWSWKVGTNTTPGTYKVIIKDGSQSITKFLTVSK